MLKDGQKCNDFLFQNVKISIDTDGFKKIIVLSYCV